MNTKNYQDLISDFWDQHVISALARYVEIKCKSPHFDPDWETNGFLLQAAQEMAQWVKTNGPKNTLADVICSPGKTPLLIAEFGNPGDKPVLVYGHYDKQPEFSGWDTDKSPWTMVQKGHHLYGRGIADDGYAIFAITSALRSLEASGQSIPHVIAIIEGSEESGSPDLAFYLDLLSHRIKSPELIICLDSGCYDYKNLWLTSSFRGAVNFNLEVKTLDQAVHSGYSGMIPSAFDIMHILLNRMIDTKSGHIQADILRVEIPEDRVKETASVSACLGEELKNFLPLRETIKFCLTDEEELQLRRSWRPALSVLGVHGIPSIEYSSSVILPAIKLQLSLRLPPTLELSKAKKESELPTRFSFHKIWTPLKGCGFQ